ncbi:hypothetical protein M9H77_06646 [Catharanthus roseus]|uniref:Uncharacterized protein n=1 Tax=Catharanthus roseus TaxID=4058 RepID=A0ACC0BSR8_CATRO|nr:hypothetical protein M9H77_06646 [Catharanthus roseus]
MQGRNTLEEVLRLSAERGYIVFYRNGEDNKGSAINKGEPIVVLTDRESGLMPTYRSECVAKLTEMVKDEEVAQRVWTSQVLHFGVETMNHAESKHSVLKLWLSMCHSDLDTVFLNIDSLIQAQVAEIKYSLEISRLKEKYGAKSNPILKNLCNKISHLGLKKIMDELKNARQMVEEPGKGDVVMFWKKLEIGSDIPEEHHRNMESEMCDLASLLQEISTGPISNVREVRRLIKAVVNPPETAVTKGRRKTNSTKRDKSHWEYVSIAHRKIGKSSGSSSGSGSGSGLGSNPSLHGRGRPSRSGRSRGRGRSSGRSRLSTVVSPDSPPVPFFFKKAFSGFTYQFIQNWNNVIGDGNCGFRIVSNFLFGDKNHWVEIRRRMSYDLRHHMRVYEQLFGSVERVTELIMQTNWEEGSVPREY